VEKGIKKCDKNCTLEKKPAGELVGVTKKTNSYL
jgi:hypothetical protein